MADHTTSSFVGSIPENYDRYLGPAHFEPFADDLAGRVAAASPQGAVLEIACGTGIVTKQLRARLPSTVRLVATDLNQPMLDHARAKLADASIEWQQADAMALPFEASSFGAVACGFGVMFMPDKSVAFRESRRVLITGGAFVFNVWDGFDGNECSRVAFDAIRIFFGGDAPAFMKIPFGFNDRDLIRRLLAGHGFDRVEIEPVTIKTSSPSARDYAIGVIRGTPTSHEIQQRGIPFDEVVEAVAISLARAFGDKPFRADRRALAVTARAA
jgi:ubiquinone/menaquinone biosynthesis C-methylase UbiE